MKIFVSLWIVGTPEGWTCGGRCSPRKYVLGVACIPMLVDAVPQRCAEISLFVVNLLEAGILLGRIVSRRRISC